MSFGKVLVVDDVDAIREIVIFYLLSVIQAEIIEANCGNQALEQLKKNPDIRLIISDQNMPNGTGTELFHALRQFSNIPFIMHTTDTREKHQGFQQSLGYYFLPKPMEIGKLDELLKVIQKNHPHEAKLTEAEKYIPVQLSLLRKMGETKAPLYIQISEDKYVKIQKEGHLDSDFMFDKEKISNIQTLYIQHQDISEYLTDYQKIVQTTLDRPELKIQSKLQQVLTTAELLQTVQSNLGISKDIENLVQGNIKTVTELAQQKSSFQILLNDFRNPDFNPKARNIVLVSMIAIAIGKELNWVNGKTSNKFVFASLVHNMTSDLTEHEVELKKEYKEMDLNFRNHSTKAAEIANKWSICPGDVGLILQQHHELPDGSGFPFGLTSSRISPLSCVYIIANEIALHFEKHGQLASIEEWLAQNQVRFSDSDFKKVMSAVLSLYQSHKNAAA